MVVLSGFAVVWAAALVGLSSLPWVVRVPCLVLAVLVAGFLNVVAGVRGFRPVEPSALPGDPARRRSVFAITNVVQAVLFSALISVGIATENLSLIPLGGSVIVGAHFWPLGRVFAERSFSVVGTAMVAVGLIGLTAVLTSIVTGPGAVGLVAAVNTVLLLAVAGRQVHRYGNQ